MRYDEADIMRALSRRAFGLAQEYVDDDMVTSFRAEGDTIHAEVEGNWSASYRQAIRFSALRGSTVIAGTCTCPVGYNCKHVGAALLFGLGSARPEPPPPPPPTMEDRVRRLVGTPALQAAPTADALMPTLQRWLDELDRARQSTSEDYSPDITQRLVYVLVPLPDRGGALARLGLRLFSTRLRKDGLFSESGRARTVHGLSSGTYLRPSDHRILRRLSPIAYMGNTADGIGLGGEAGAEILADILATGRVRWREVNGQSLAAGAARPGRIAWMPAGEAAIAPRISLDGDAVAFLATPPVYVDAAAGLVGPIETPYPPAIAAALLAAPEVPAEMIGTVNAALAKCGPELSAAAAPEPARDRIEGAAPVPVLRLFAAELPVTADRDAAGRRYYSFSLPLEQVGLARLSFRYGPVDAVLGDGRRVQTRLVRDRLVEVHRNREAEDDAVATLLASGFDPAPERRRTCRPPMPATSSPRATPSPGSTRRIRSCRACVSRAGRSSSRRIFRAA